MSNQILYFWRRFTSQIFDLWEDDCEDVEVAIVAGTSLTVFPFASLPGEVNKKCLRVLVNKEKVGTFKHEPRKSDIIALHDCDIVAEKLCTLLGLDDKLNEVYEKEKLNTVKQKQRRPRCMKLKIN